MPQTLIETLQIRNYGLLSGLASSGVDISFSGNVFFASGNLAAIQSFTNTGYVNDLTVSGSIHSPYLSGLLQTTVVGSGSTYWSSVIDISGNNVNYFIQYSTGTIANIIFSASTQDSSIEWEYLNGNTWSPFPILGLNSAQQLSAIVRHSYVATGLDPHIEYIASTRAIYAGNVTGQFFDSAKFYPDSQGFQVALVPSFKQIFDNFDSRYVVKMLNPNGSTISGSSASGIPLFLQSADGGFPTQNLGTGMAVWNNQSTGFFIYNTGIGFSGFRLINNISSVTGISGVRVNQPTGNIVLFLDYGTGSGQPPSGNDLRFFSKYHQSGSPDPLNIGGLSGVAATGQPVNVYNQTTYVGTYPILAFSGRGVNPSGDSLNGRNLIILNYVQALQGNSPSPILTDNIISVLGTGNIFVSGVPGTGIDINRLYIYDTGTQAISVASGATVTGNAILSGAGNITVIFDGLTPSGRIITISGSSTAGGSSAGGVTGIATNGLPLFTGGFVFSGQGGITALTTNFGVGISGIIFSGSSANNGGVTGVGLNTGPLFTGGFGFSGTNSASVSLSNFGNGITGVIIDSTLSLLDRDQIFLEIWQQIGY